MTSGAPLAGRRILVTRRAGQSSALRDSLVSLGAEVLEAPTIEIVAPADTGPLDRALERLHHYHWVLFTSANAVRLVAERLRQLRRGAPSLSSVRVASVGPSTTAAYREHFAAAVDLEPEKDFRAEGLLAALGDAEGLCFLYPTSDKARDVVPRTLTARGGSVDVVAAYRTIVAPEAERRLQEALDGGVDLVTFASPSAVDGFVAAVGATARKGIPAAVIGPVTAEAARAAGFDVRVVAAPSTVEGLVAGIRVAFP